jgi:hypothetical protein
VADLNDVRHVILVPARGKRSLLLSPGICGSRPPFAVLRLVGEDRHETWEAEEGHPIGYCLSCGMTGPCPSAGEVESVTPEHWEAGRWHYANADSGAWPGVALVLAWDGKAVGAGTDLLWRLLAPGAETPWPYWPHGLVESFVQHALHRDDDGEGETARRWLADRTSALGTLKLLGADGQEVTHG